MARQEGVEPLSAEQQAQYEALARGNTDDTDLDQSPTAQFITQRLVAFRSVAELQEKNEHLLQLTRKLA